MKRSSATIAIVMARLQRKARVLIVAACACALLAYLQRYDDPEAQLAGSLVFGTLIGIATSLLQRGAGRLRDLELCEQSAPLYGRELARATALVPGMIVACAVAAYWIVAAAYGRAYAPYIAIALCASSCATLVAMCASVRTGFARVLYIAFACIVSALAFAMLRWTPVATLIFCFGAGFVALRQYGEALARYNPI